MAAARIRAPKGPAEVKQIEMEARILTEVDSLNRQRLGSNALYALLALADAFTGVEGRKTVLLFSEGLPVPEAVADVLDRVVSQANRANLTLYAFDARGLAPEGGFEESKRALLAARHLSERAMRSTGSEEGPTRGVSPVEVQTHELALDAIRLNGQANLRDLAEATGGFLVAETNDLAAAMERVGADLRSYYEIGYVPAMGSRTAPSARSRSRFAAEASRSERAGATSPCRPESLRRFPTSSRSPRRSASSNRRTTSTTT